MHHALLPSAHRGFIRLCAALRRDCTRLRPGLRRGFTLVELILYIGLSSMILVALLRIMLTLGTLEQRSESVGTAQQELRSVVGRLAVSVREALNINASASVFGSSGGVLSLAMSGSTKNPTIFSLSGSRIFMKQGSSPGLALTSPRVRVDQLQFTNLSAVNTNGIVKIIVRGSEDLPDAEPVTIETSLSLRQ